MGLMSYFLKLFSKFSFFKRNSANKHFKYQDNNVTPLDSYLQNISKPLKMCNSYHKKEISFQRFAFSIVKNVSQTVRCLFLQKNSIIYV